MIKNFSISFSRVIIVQDFETVTLKQNFLKKSSRTLILATCFSSIQSYFKIDLDLTVLLNVYFLYRKS